MRYVLLIPGWFPSRVNFLAGDFIERHARAMSVHVPVVALFVVKDDTLPVGSTEHEVRKVSDQYQQHIFYYGASATVPFFGKITSAFMQWRCLWQGFQSIIKEHGLPSIIHAHVLVKHAWFALRISKRYKIPLMASEQWTGYLPEAVNDWNQLRWWERRPIGKVLHHASAVTVVSDYLGQQLVKRFGLKRYEVIPNLVDTGLFKVSSAKTDIPTFIHVSTLSEQKNFAEILKACEVLRDRGVDFRLQVVAPANDYWRQAVSNAELTRQVEFLEEAPQEVISRYMAASDALILYSNYETFGCVVAEANACGIPVIASDFPVFHENIMEGETGFRVPLHQPTALADCMLRITQGKSLFDKEKVRAFAVSRYSAEVIGKQLAEVCLRLVKP